MAWHATASPGSRILLNKELVVGGSSTASDADQFAKLLNALFGTKLRLATGYPGGNEINLAIERGKWWRTLRLVLVERGGDAPSTSSANRIAVLIQTALTKHADLPDVPLIADIAAEQQRQIVQLVRAASHGPYPFMAPPAFRRSAPRSCAKPSCAR